MSRKGGCPVPDRYTPPDAETFRLEVIDTGMGISAKDIPRLFADFLQLETTRKSISQGAGRGRPRRKPVSVRLKSQGGRKPACTSSRREAAVRKLTPW